MRLLRLFAVSRQTSTAPIHPSQDILPSQFFRLRAALQPEKRLMLAVLEDAVQMLQRYAGEPSAHARRLFAETVAWFASDAADSAFAFVSICQALDFEPSYLRAGLRPWSRTARLVPGISAAASPASSRSSPLRSTTRGTPREHASPAPTA